MSLSLFSLSPPAFGIDIGSIQKSDVDFARAFDYCQTTVAKRFTAPHWRLRMRFSADEAKYRVAKKVIDDFCYKVVKERRQTPRDGDNNTDLLSLFMNKKNTEGQDYDDEYLKDLMLNFVIAGRDTTANALSWAFYALSSHHQVEETLAKEISETFGDSDPTFEVKEMRYATAFVSETLRLYPSVPKDPKNAVADDVLPDGTQIKAGDWIVYLPWVMGRLKSIWGEDCNDFKPERWLESDTKISPYTFTAFQAGPRSCLGQDMAYLEMKVITCMILQKYRLRLVPGQNITYQNNITLPMKDFSMMMTVERRT